LFTCSSTSKMAHLLALRNNQRAGLYAKAPVGVGQIRVILFTFPEAHQVEPGNVRSRASQKPLSLSTAHVAASSSCCAKIRVRTPARAETEGEERTRESHRMQSGGRKHACMHAWVVVQALFDLLCCSGSVSRLAMPTKAGCSDAYGRECLWPVIAHCQCVLIDRLKR
jgi:hypothetical protein